MPALLPPPSVLRRQELTVLLTFVVYTVSSSITLACACLPNWLSTCWMEVEIPIHTDGKVWCSFISLAFPLLGGARMWSATVKSDDRWTVWEEHQKGLGLAVRASLDSKCWQVAEKEASGRTVAWRGSGALSSVTPLMEDRWMAGWPVTSPLKPLESGPFVLCWTHVRDFNTLSEFAFHKNVKLDCTIQPDSTVAW